MKEESQDKEMDSSHRPVVLYVDDVTTNLMLFKAAFDKDYEILLAESGANALEILEMQTVNVLVADYKMPGITGNELLSIVAGKYPDVMRFMITAYTDYATLVEAINKGQLYGFFNKPYKIDEVRQAINRSLEVQDLKVRNREMIRELEKANEAMLGLDRAKTRFIATITNDIRNPINKIVTAVHMIKDKVDSKEFTELLYLLDTSVRNLEGFSEAASHFIRLNEKGCQVEKAPVSINEVIEVGILEKGNFIQQQDIHIHFNPAENELVTAGEFDLLLAAFVSLLGYLVNHAPKGADMKLSLQTTEAGNVIEFSPDGIELSEDEIHELRMVTAGKVAYDDIFRLELALVSEIMKAHEGKFTLKEADNRYIFSLVFKP